MPRGEKQLRKLSQARAEETRSRILDCARTVFVEQGFAGANLRDIAREAGTTHSMITYHFGTKDQLWRAVVRHMFDQIQTEVFDRVDPDEALGAKERFIQFTRLYARYCAVHPDHARITIAESMRGGERLEWMVETFVQTNHDAIIPVVKALIAHQVIPEMPVESFIYSYVSMLQLPFVLANEAKALGYDFTSDAAIARHTDAVLALILTRTPTA